MNKGWIKLHRALSDWEWYDDHNATRLLVHLLISVNYEDKKWKGIVIPKGSIICSWSNLADAVGFTEMQCRTAMKKLEQSGEVTRKVTNKYQLVSLVKWEKFQLDCNDVTDKPSAKQQTDNRQITTTKEYKERKERKEVYRSFAHLSISIEEKDKILADGYTQKQLDDILDGIENFTGNKKYKSLYLTAKNWIKKEPKPKTITTNNWMGLI